MNTPDNYATVIFNIPIGIHFDKTGLPEEFDINKVVDLLQKIWSAGATGGGEHPPERVILEKYFDRTVTDVTYDLLVVGFRQVISQSWQAFCNTQEQETSVLELARQQVNKIKPIAFVYDQACLDAEKKTELPRYQSHKVVQAMKIKDIHDPTLPNEESDGSRLLIPDDSTYAPIKVDHQYMHKHRPRIGGYYVVYADGYQSYSPAEAFESGYTRI